MTVPELSHQLGLSQNSRRSDPGKSFDIFDGADRRRRLHLPSRLPKKQVRYHERTLASRFDTCACGQLLRMESVNPKGRAGLHKNDYTEAI
jgi:hypothetical protein